MNNYNLDGLAEARTDGYSPVTKTVAEPSSAGITMPTAGFVPMDRPEVIIPTTTKDAVAEEGSIGGFGGGGGGVSPTKGKTKPLYSESKYVAFIKKNKTAILVAAAIAGVTLYFKKFK